MSLNIVRASGCPAVYEAPDRPTGRLIYWLRFTGLQHTRRSREEKVAGLGGAFSVRLQLFMYSMCNVGITCHRSPSDWCFEYLDEASTTKSNDTPSRSQPPTTPSHSPDDFSGLTPADIITDPSLVPVSPFDLLPGGVTKDEPEDLDLDIQIFLGLETSSSSPARRSISTDISSPPRRSPSTDVEGVHHHCPEKSCGQSFKRINALNRHISSIHKRTGVLCPFCPGTKKVFNRSDNFQR